MKQAKFIFTSQILSDKLSDLLSAIMAPSFFSAPFFFPLTTDKECKGLENTETSPSASRLCADLDLPQLGIQTDREWSPYLAPKWSQCDGILGPVDLVTGSFTCMTGGSFYH